MQKHHLTREKRENWTGGVQQRLSLEGALPTRFPLSFVTAMLQVLVQDAPVTVAHRDFLTSFKRRSGSFRVSYPATSRDELTPAEAREWVRLRVPVRDRRVPYEERKTITLEIVAPGDTLLAKALIPKLFRQLWQSQPDMPKWSKSDLDLLGYDLPDRIYRLVELDGEQQQLYLYSRGETNPTLAQLLKLSGEETLYVTAPFDRYNDEYQPIPLHIERADGPLADAEAEDKGIGMRWNE